jgi:hypothetical protein
VKEVNKCNKAKERLFVLSRALVMRHMELTYFYPFSRFVFDPFSSISFAISTKQRPIYYFYSKAQAYGTWQPDRDGLKVLFLFVEEPNKFIKLPHGNISL